MEDVKWSKNLEKYKKYYTNIRVIDKITVYIQRLNLNTTSNVIIHGLKKVNLIKLIYF